MKKEELIIEKFITTICLLQDKDIYSTSEYLSKFIYKDCIFKIEKCIKVFGNYYLAIIEGPHNKIEVKISKLNYFYIKDTIERKIIELK